MYIHTNPVTDKSQIPFVINLLSRAIFIQFVHKMFGRESQLDVHGISAHMIQLSFQSEHTQIEREGSESTNPNADIQTNREKRGLPCQP